MPSYLKEEIDYSIEEKSYSTYERDNSKLTGGSIWAAVSTNMTFILNDIRKRDREFKIGMISVFLVVSFTSLLTAFLNSTPSLFFMVSQANSGDFDVTMTALSSSKQYESGNYNFYLNA